jgi:hypothetical protein
MITLFGHKQNIIGQCKGRNDISNSTAIEIKPSESIVSVKMQLSRAPDLTSRIHILIFD